MKKIQHPESRTAFILEDTSEFFLGALVAQRLAELAPGALDDAGQARLHRNIYHGIGLIQEGEIVPQQVVFYGAEARAMLVGMQAVLEGSLLGGEDSRHERRVHDRALAAKSAVGEYYDPERRADNDLRQLIDLSKFQQTAQLEAAMADEQISPTQVYLELPVLATVAS